MTGAELRAALADLGISQVWLARRMGAHPVTIYRQCEAARVRDDIELAIELLRRLPSDELARFIDDSGIPNRLPGWQPRD